MKKEKNKKNKTVFVGISGGVDSSTSAALLKKHGYNVVGVYIDLQSGEVAKKSQVNIRAVEEICKQLKIPLKIYSLQKEFEKTVIRKFIDEYQKGNTPNPCIYCNERFKFGLFFRMALKDGADYIATGHYVQTRFESGEYKLLKGKDAKKDQSYFLYNLNQEILSKVIFPVGHLKKTEVRRIAGEFNLPTAQKEESQDVCFILNNDVQSFLRSKTEENKGQIIDIDSGKNLGKHNGLAFYTIGQRRGIGIGGSGDPYFVVGKDTAKNVLFVGKGVKHPALFKNEIEIKSLNWISDKKPQLPIGCEVSIRYRQKPQKAIVGAKGGKIAVTFEDPVRAVSPGQSAVLYQGKTCLGGGIIK